MRLNYLFGISLIWSNDWEVQTVPQGYVLGPRDGEHLILRGGDIFINVDPVTGSDGLAMGSQQILVGVGIPIHRHFEMDEAFYVIEGRGNFILNDVGYPIEKGGSIFIPKNAWHGFETPSMSSSCYGLSHLPGWNVFSAK